jgi:hypothetical protein
MKLIALYDKNNYFTELIKIENFTTVKEALERINKWIEGVDDLSEYDEDDLFYSKDNDDRNYKYVYTSNDGQCSFVESLDEFAESHNTEEKWGVFKTINLKD